MTSQQEGSVSVTLQSAVQEQGHSKGPPQSFRLALWQLTRTEMFCALFCSTALSWSLPKGAHKLASHRDVTLCLLALGATEFRKIPLLPSWPLPSFPILMCRVQAPPIIGLEQESNTSQPLGWAEP